jgi:hypothetical protein
LALVFGKDLVLINALGVLFGANIWGVYATTYITVFGVHILPSVFGGGAVQDFGPAIVADRTFLIQLI